MSRCSGRLDGYYYNNELVYMSSVYGAETGFSSKEVYVKDGVVYKMRYREHYAEWEKHHQNFPNDEGFEHMTYTDTLYTIFFSMSPLVYKTSGSKFVKTDNNEKLLKRLLDCAESMRLELQSDSKKKG